jgi:hypothetical protein
MRKPAARSEKALRFTTISEGINRKPKMLPHPRIELNMISQMDIKYAKMWLNCHPATPTHRTSRQR